MLVRASHPVNAPGHVVGRALVPYFGADEPAVKPPVNSKRPARYSAVRLVSSSRKEGFTIRSSHAVLALLVQQDIPALERAHTQVSRIFISRSNLLCYPCREGTPLDLQASEQGLGFLYDVSQPRRCAPAQPGVSAGPYQDSLYLRPALLTFTSASFFFGFPCRSS